MDKPQSIAEWMAERRVSADELLRVSLLEKKVLDAILQGRYTPSPQQRQGIAAALGVTIEQVAWGHAIEPQHLYGHGPQFGRTP